jgi:hypothetical protein
MWKPVEDNPLLRTWDQTDPASMPIGDDLRIIHLWNLTVPLFPTLNDFRITVGQNGRSRPRKVGFSSQFPAITAQHEIQTTSRNLDRRSPVQRSASGASGSGQNVGNRSSTGKSLGIQRERKWVFGARRTIVCPTDVYCGSRHTPSGSSLQ